MGRGLFGYVGLAATVALAAPVALLGLVLLGDGDTLAGAALLGIALLMVAVEEYVTTPTDVTGEVAGDVVDAVADDPDEEG